MRSSESNRSYMFPSCSRSFATIRFRPLDQTLILLFVDFSHDHTITSIFHQPLGPRATSIMLSMDGIILSRMPAYFFNQKKGVSDPSLNDLASVLAVGKLFLQNWQILSSKHKTTFACARRYYYRCACTAFAYLSHEATIPVRLPDSLLDTVVRVHVRTSPRKSSYTLDTPSRRL